MQPAPFQHVLAAVDAQEESNLAAVRGAGLARELGAELDIVHAVDVPPPMWPGLKYEDLNTLHADALKEARVEVLARLTPALHAAGFQVEADQYLRVGAGPAARVVLAAVEECGADLLVLGPHTKRKGLDFGGTTRSLLAHSPVPVWLQSGPVEPVREVLVAVDFSDHSRLALQIARDVAVRYEARVEVLHCHADPTFAYSQTGGSYPSTEYIEKARTAAREELERWVGELDWGPVSASATFVEREPVECIRERAAGAALTVMGTHGRTGLSRFLLGSIAYSVVKHSTRALLAVPAPDRAWQMG